MPAVARQRHQQARGLDEVTVLVQREGLQEPQVHILRRLRATVADQLAHQINLAVREQMQVDDLVLHGLVAGDGGAIQRA